MKEGQYQDLYAHIQSLYSKADCEINFFDNDELIDELIGRRLTLEQLENICAIRYWFWVIVLNKMRYLKETHHGTSDTTFETNFSFISTIGSDYAKSRGANQDKFGINNYYIDKTKADCFGTLLLKSTLVKENPSDARILYIGARTEAEILYMANFGINPRNITAIDLHSYSPLIELGDMHSLSFSDNTFDACMLSHCIAYSEAPEIAFKEALRTLKRRGSLIFTVSSVHEHSNLKKQQPDTMAPRTGAKGILTFEEYYKIACNLTENKKTCKYTFEYQNTNKSLMRAGIIPK